MEKLELITQNLAEIVGIEDLRLLLFEKSCKIYWGTAPTGKPHLGYFVPILKIADFLKAECDVTILFADLHAVLEGKTSLDILEARCEYYEVVIKAMLNQIGVSTDRLKFIRGRSFQLNPKYTMDLYRLCTINTIEQAKRAGNEVVKIEEDPTLSNVIYPLLQCLDEEYLQVDAQFGGLDQRKIFMCARENLPKIGYRKRIHLMNPLIPGLGKNGKMSSTEPTSKIDFEDSDDEIIKKLRSAFSVDGLEIAKLIGKDDEEQSLPNCLMLLLKYVVFPFLKDRSFLLIREEKYGGNVEYKNYEEIRQDFLLKNLVSIDLKLSLIPEIIKIVTPIRELIQTQYRDLSQRAYPKN
jgi:tyrosyl-tRNA synthetase